MFVSVTRSQLCSASSGTPDLQPVPDPGAGEGVSVQPLPDQKAQDRDRPLPVPHGAANQNLVPEPTHEAEEGEASHPGVKQQLQIRVQRRR